MHERVRTINKYYNNLEYYGNNGKMEASLKVVTLFKQLKFEDTDTIAIRFLRIASLIEKNLNLFMSVCQHVDIVTTILDYLYYYGASFSLDSECANYYDTTLHVMLTIYNVYKEQEIQLFLEAIIPESNRQNYYDFKNVAAKNIEIMILFEDSDLYGVINYLKFTRLASVLNKIWVQESIVQTFIWHFKKCFEHLNVPIHIFQSKQELFINTSNWSTDVENKINIVSIWSENIIAAKNLAKSLNQHIVFINTHMDICPDIMLPYFDILFKSLFVSFKDIKDEHTCINPINPISHKGLTYDLFYDGMWQKPKKNTYWIHNEILLANSICEDVMECIKSARKGFQTWNTISSEFKMQILSKFATTLECNGKILLANVILEWINMSYISGCIRQCFQTERFEIIKARKPQGTVILKEKDEITLFRELTQSLIIGNSVIVICVPDLCTLAPYCDMFKISGIPPGVINLLSRENTQNIKYDNFASSTSSEVFNGLTITQQIVISRK